MYKKIILLSVLMLSQHATAGSKLYGAMIDKVNKYPAWENAHQSNLLSNSELRILMDASVSNFRSAILSDCAQSTVVNCAKKVEATKNQFKSEIRSHQVSPIDSNKVLNSVDKAFKLNFHGFEG